MANNASTVRDKAEVYCLEAVDGEHHGDLEEEVFQRLDPARTRVRKRSACEFRGVYGEVFERATGKQGIIVPIGPVAWRSATEATVEGGCYEALLSSSGNVYHVKKISGVWTVTKNEMKWIS